MIGYYVHHVGQGHVHRAIEVARRLGEQVTGLSSLPRPDGWPGPWLELPRDDDQAGDGGGGEREDVTAGGRLHWAPLHDGGLRGRMAEVSAWACHVVPRAIVVDASVEVCLLARLHGVPVVSVVLPGVRDDPAHRLGFDVASELVGFWPAEAEGMVRPPEIAARVRAVGALARYDVQEPGDRRGGPRRVAYLAGSGGDVLDPALLAGARAQSPDWEWKVLGGPAAWDDDPHPALADADVVVTHAGQHAVAEVAALRRPAVVVPQDRPHEEQRTTARALAAGGWPVLVEETFPADGWSARLTEAAGLDPGRWATWCDGAAAERAAAVVLKVAEAGRR